MKPLFLIGFMGCGKTTWGKKIARISGLPFIDLDQEIIRETGMSISDYFAIQGETKFRELESRLLQLISPDSAAVISTGGGAPCYRNNMDWMNQSGITIYLKMSPAALLSRLSGKEGSKRPLLQGKNREEMLDFIEMKLEERETFYEKAGFIVDALNSNPVMLWQQLSKEQPST